MWVIAFTIYICGYGISRLWGDAGDRVLRICGIRGLVGLADIGFSGISGLLGLADIGFSGISGLLGLADIGFSGLSDIGIRGYED